MMCRVLNVSRSSYYRWLKDPVGKRKRKSMKLSREIKDAYFNAKGRNGCPRLVGDLRVLGNLTIDEFWNQYNLKKESIKNVA